MVKRGSRSGGKQWARTLFDLLQRDVPRLVAINSLVTGLGFASGVLLARTLLPAGRGEFAAAILWPTLLVNLGGLGLPQAVTYYAGRRRTTFGTVMGTALALGFALGALLFVLGWFLILPLALQAQSPVVLSVARLNLVLTAPTMGIALQLFVLQGVGELRLWGNLRLMQSLLYVLGLIALALSRESTVWSIMLVLSITALLPGLVALIQLTRKLNCAIGFEAGLAKDILVYGLKNILGGIAEMVNLRLDQAVMTLLIAPQQLGLYAVAVALAQGLQPVSAAFANVAFPRVTHTEALPDARKVIRRLFRANLIASLGFGLPLALAAPHVVTIVFGPAYSDAGWAARILTVAAIFFGVNYVLSDSLRGLNAPLGPSVAQGIGTVVTLVGLYALLPFLGIVGAAVTSLLSYSMSSLVLILLLWRHFGIAPLALAMGSSEDAGVLQQAWKAIYARWATPRQGAN